MTSSFLEIIPWRELNKSGKITKKKFFFTSKIQRKLNTAQDFRSSPPKRKLALRPGEGVRGAHKDCDKPFSNSLQGSNFRLTPKKRRGLCRIRLGRQLPNTAKDFFKDVSSSTEKNIIAKKREVYT